MGFGLHNATGAPRSSRTSVGHAGAAIFERTTTPLATVLLASAYDRFSRFFTSRKPMILVFHTSRFESKCSEFPLLVVGRGGRLRLLCCLFCLTAVVHRQAEAGGAGCQRKLRTAALPSFCPSPSVSARCVLWRLLYCFLSLYDRGLGRD